MGYDTRVVERLALAAGTLLGGGLAAASGEEGTRLDLAVLSWDEQDRVTAVEPVIGLRRDLGDDRALSLKLVLDSLSGASHNGANVQPYVQTFAAASGGTAGYTVPAGEVPLDPGFEDFRTAFSVGYETPLANPLWKTSLGASISRETDFLSLAASATLARDFNRRNTTVVGGLSLEADEISPAGGAPEPFALRVAAAGGGEEEGEDEGEDEDDGEEAPAETRQVVDVMLGVTQVLNRTTLVQFNVAASMATGYMNDPYKLVTVDTLPATYVYESRPDSRNKFSLYGEIKHAFASGDIVDTGYRWMRDDWGVTSHTVDLYYRAMLPANWYIEPHVRWYTQTAADFFVMSLAPADVPPAGSSDVYASGDYRLGALQDTTIGARIGVRVSEGAELYLRAEQMHQEGDWAPANLDATILELGGSWQF